MMKNRMLMIAMSTVVWALPTAYAQTNVGNTQKGSADMRATSGGGSGAGTLADSMHMRAQTVKDFPPCQGSRMRASDVTAIVTGSPGGMASPDQVAPLPPRARSKSDIRADSIRALTQDTVPNCAAMTDSLRRLRRAQRDSTPAKHWP
jgi:hypothetical protein